MEQHGWYFVENNQPVGPISLSSLQAKIHSGSLAPNDLVYHKDIGWRELSSISEFEAVYQGMLSNTSFQPKDISIATSSEPLPAEQSVFHSKRLLIAALTAGLIIIALFIIRRDSKPTSAKLVEVEVELEQEQVQTEIEETAPAPAWHVDAVVEIDLDSVLAELRAIRRNKIVEQLVRAAEEGRTLNIDWTKNALYDLAIIDESIGQLGSDIRPANASTDEERAICGMLDFETADFRQAVRNLERIFDLKSRPVAQQYLGLAYFWTGDYEQAVQSLEKSLNDNPGDIELNLAYIEAMRRLGKEDSLKLKYDDKVSSHPDSAVLNYIRGLLDDDVPSAIDYLIRSVSQDENFAPAYFEQAARLLLMRRPDEARETVNKLILVWKPDPFLDLLDARIYYQSEDFRKAVEAAGRAIEGYEKAGKPDFRIWADIVTIKSLIDDNKIKQAKTYLRTLGDWHARSADLALELTLIYNKIARTEKEFQAAAKILLEAGPRTKRCSPALGQQRDFELGMTYLEAGRLEKALEQFNRLTVEDSIRSPYPVAAGFWKGVALALSGRHKQARQQWHMMPQSFPSEKFPGIVECLCAEYLAGSTGQDVMIGNFESASMLKRALISYSIALKAQSQGKLVPARKYFSTAMACLRQRKNVPHYLVQRSMGVIEKSLIVPD